MTTTRCNVRFAFAMPPTRRSRSGAVFSHGPRIVLTPQVATSTLLQSAFDQPCYSESGKGDASIASQALGLL
jgi:hypothetical protein